MLLAFFNTDFRRFVYLFLGSCLDYGWLNITHYYCVGKIRRGILKVNLVAIKRSEDETTQKSGKAGIINVPLPNTIIYEGDILMLAGSDLDLAKLPQE